MISRRTILSVGGIFVGGAACGAKAMHAFLHTASMSHKAKSSTSSPSKKLPYFLTPTLNWTEVEFYKFCMSEDHVPPDGIVSLRMSVGLDKPKSGVRSEEVKEIQKGVSWVSSNVLAYPFKDEEQVNYHELCRWVALKLELDPWTYKTQPTLMLERAICEKLWADIWDKLNADQRKALLSKIENDVGLPGVDIAALVAMSGSAALATLATTVAFAGFAFYSTMSVTICTVAAWFGVTLPFAVYAGASTLVGFLAGPVGWALVGIGAVASVALMGKADVQKTAMFITQTHFLKIAALKAAGADALDVPKRPF